MRKEIKHILRNIKWNFRTKKYNVMVNMNYLTGPWYAQIFD